MTIDNKDLLLDLVEWISESPRSYDDVMSAWRTSCPRLQIWEDAIDHGFVTRRQSGQGVIVEVTNKGIGFLREHRLRSKS